MYVYIYLLKWFIVGGRLEVGKLTRKINALVLNS